MRLNAEVQAGLLMVLYLTRSGRSKLSDISANLSISQSLLQKVAKKLKSKGILSTTKGSSGGYSVSPNVDMISVIYSLDAYGFLPPGQFYEYSRGMPEKRALAKFVYGLSEAVGGLMVKEAKKVMDELVKDELVTLDTINEIGLIEN